MSTVRSALVRLTRSGKPDRSFSRDGRLVSLRLRNGDISDIASTRGGKIVAVGNGRRSFSALFFVARFTRRGHFDRTFAGDGQKVVGRPSRNEGTRRSASAVAVRRNGKIVAVGVKNNKSFLLVQLRANGALDKRFSGDGRVTSSYRAPYYEDRYCPCNQYVKDVAVDRRGRVVFAGTARDLPVLARYTPRGRVDRSFGVNGVVAPPRLRGTDPAGAVIQSNGKIVLGGAFVPSSKDAASGFVVSRFSSSGGFDASFGNGGVQRTALPGYAQGITLQPGGNVVLAGRTDNAGVLLRYLGR